jgi:hypothetical protein
MRAKVGDRIVVRGLHVGDAEKEGEIIAVEGADGAPPYQVRWRTDGHVSFFFPGADATIQHAERQEAENG